jgi:hypothetical protein
VVDACLPCNRLKGRSDEYLRDFLTLDFRGSRSPIAHEIFESKVRRSHRRNSSELIRKAMQLVSIEPLYTRAGVYLGHFPQTYVDDDRLSHALGMMVKGLFFDARKNRLPDDCRVTIVRHDPWDYAAVIQAFDLPSKPSSRRVGEVFRCAFRWATEDPRLTLWLLLFYGRVLFSATTEPMDPEASDDA